MVGDGTKADYNTKSTTQRRKESESLVKNEHVPIWNFEVLNGAHQTNTSSGIANDQVTSFAAQHQESTRSGAINYITVTEDYEPFGTSGGTVAAGIFLSLDSRVCGAKTPKIP